MHAGNCRGHLYQKATAYKILRARYYWPTLSVDTFKNIRACEKCQKFSGKHKVQSLPLKPVLAEKPFQQWALDFIGEIVPASSGQHKYILTTTDYFTKWIESIPTKIATNKVIMQFLEENIFSIFGCPKKLVADNAQAFKSGLMVNFCQKYNVVLSHSTTYYPQGNRLA